MIIAKLIGGLGNTMFQYAIARIIADQKQCNLLVEGIDTLTKFFPNAVNITDCNLLNMDVQGYELEVLKGGNDTLKYIDYIFTEVNEK